MFLSRCAAHCGFGMLGLPDIYVCQHLNVIFGKHWICRGGSVQWPARSPYLTCLDFLCSDQMKTLVYETSVDSVEDVVARISVTARWMRDMPGIFQNVGFHPAPL
ncbi:hypothetical protein AVEN_207442-1 [Araneus ventricosus]|uniref:Uncharacterized protein n=1 Tax=Araneus ventricosus TaxID=182803 RepID=A0A4Y2E956_ARAVE|nr:hypothetical protein AVEN_207442-1 [Araneus ventricosus]